ncbi:hypothetical protein ACSYGO_46275 [Streptomyces krungchingensis]
MDFRLVAGEGIRWWKGLYVPDGLGSAWEIWTQNDRTSDSVALWAHQVANGQDLEFRKAKLFGVHTGMYALGNLERLAGGTRVTFQWAQDEDPYPFAWLVDAQINLPQRGGRYHAQPNQQFQARVRYLHPEGPIWTRDARIKLGSQAPPDNTTWGLNRVEISQAGDAPWFTINARAPSAPGEYLFHWRLLQEGVRWFGPTWARTVVVDPPPPPSGGEATIVLTRPDPADVTYDADSPDPSVTPAYPMPRHALVQSVLNTSGHRLFLAHRDRVLHQTQYVLLNAHQEYTVPFAGLEVEGLWRAQYRGSILPPAELTLSVTWHAP